MERGLVAYSVNAVCEANGWRMEVTLQADRRRAAVRKLVATAAELREQLPGARITTGAIKKEAV